MTKEDFFKENFPEYVTEKGEFLTPYWDLFNAGVICDTFESKVKIEQLEKENAELKKDKSELCHSINEAGKAYCNAQKKAEKQLTKAKEHIENLLYYVKQCTCERSNYEEINKDIKEAEQFLNSEVVK